MSVREPNKELDHYWPVGNRPLDSVIADRVVSCDACGAPVLVACRPDPYMSCTGRRIKRLIETSENPEIVRDKLDECLDEVLDGASGFTRSDKTECTHGITFDEVVAEKCSVSEVRANWPRLYGSCPLGCGYNGIYYASTAHFVMGDW